MTGASLDIDVDRARAETPGCRRVAHLNNAGAALAPEPVLAAVVAHLRRESEIGAYEAAVEAADALERPYSAAATLLGCRPEEIAVVESATRGWQLAFGSVPLSAGDRVLTSSAEYGSNHMGLLHAAHRSGIEVEVLPDDEHGQLSVDALADALDDRVKLVAVTHVPSAGGLVNPVAEVGKLTRAAGVPFLLDACQSAGQVPLDVDAIGCDLLVTTSRKYLRGPRGAGLVYARAAMLDRLEPAVVDMRAATWEGPDRFRLRPDARRFETSEMSYAAKIGLGVALEYALGWRVDAIWSRVRALGERLRSQLSGVPGVTVRDRGVERCGIVTFTVERHEPWAVRDHLSRAGVNVWVVEAASGWLDLPRRGLDAVVRASVHYYNTDDELDRCCYALSRLS